MAVSLLAHEVSDLCIGKPPLRTLPVTATVAEALTALKRSRESYLSVWNCASDDHREGCVCVGRICIGDAICFLAREENLSNPASALLSPLSVLIPKLPRVVAHLEPNASLLEAIDKILKGAQHLVIPLKRNSWRRLLHKPSINGGTPHNSNREYCWLTPEDILRYLINSISIFNPTPTEPINTLNVIDADDILAVHYYDPASSALPSIAKSLCEQKSVAVVDSDGRFIGEVSPFMVNSCDETAAAAIATLSVGDLMAYVECGGSPEDLVRLVKERLEEENLGAFLEYLDEDSGILSSSSSFSSYSSSSDEEHSGLSRGRRRGGYKAVRRSEATVCYPWNSLVAVMMQALSRRMSYVWVVEEDGTLTGIVTVVGILKLLQGHLNHMVLHHDGA